MGKTKGKQRQDKYYHLAKEQGYRSRAAFKLLQLDARFRFLPTARAVLDLCAAPGGWVQVAVKHAPVGAFVVGVDLVPIRPIRGAHSLTEDITTSKCRSSVRKLMDSKGVAAFDVVLHDGSPNVGGAWAQEATTQSALVIDAVRLATYFLAPKGAFITKVFRSQDYNAIMFCLKQLFEKVEVTKPQASRGTSAEIYIICLKYKAPAKIQPELLDIKHLFNVENEKKMPRDVLTTSKKEKRSRDGYEEGVTVLGKVGLASDFIFSEAQTPLEFLGSVAKISFDDPASLPLKNHEITTDEIKHLCEDLRVLDKNSFKHILKWRIRLRKALSSSSQVTPKAAVTATESKVIDDDQLLQEMEELTSVIDRKKRQEKKRQSRRKAKDKARKATGMQIDATEEGYGDPDLFSINAIKGGKELKAVESAEFNVEDGSGDSENEATQTHEDSDEEMDSDEEQQRYDAQLEDILDEAYERFVTKRGGEVKQERKRAKRVNSDADADLLEGGEDDGEDVVMDDEGSDEDQDEDEEANPLLLRLDAEKRTKDEIVDQWFSQDVFVDAGTGLAEQSDSDDEREKPRKNMKKKIDSGNKEKPAKAQIDLGKKEKPDKAAQRLQQDDIEMVPVEPVRTEDDSDSSSSSDESEPEEDLDDDQKAEVLAYAHKMLRKKQREQILDDAYNRYMFDDEGLPKWFTEDEKRHTQAMKPITKEEVAAMKAQFREIDARPSKKVAEAKARKKRVALKKLEKARQKADIVADQSDINEQSKAKMIDKIYRKAVSTQRPKKEYVVAKKGVQVRTGKGKVLVDPRMKKDKRAEKAGKKKGKGGKGGAKGGKGKKGAGGGQKKGGMRGQAGGKASR
ncbi:hypothetical protein ACQ4PT_030431 [Festuca glaucescens]